MSILKLLGWMSLLIKCLPSFAFIVPDPECSANNNSTKIINISYILKVLDTINYSKKFECYTLVLTNLLDEWYEDDISLFRQRMYEHDMQPHILIYNRHTHLHISNILNLNSITIVFVKNSRDNVLDMVSTEILHNFKLSTVMVVITGVLHTNPEILLMVHRIMTYLSRENIINSVVIYDDNAFKMDLYPYPKTVNVTGVENTLVLRMHRSKNFQGYRIKTPIKNDLPRVFKAPDYNTSKKIHGIAGVLFSNYVKYHNGQLEEYPLHFQIEHPFVNFNGVLKLIQDEEIEISLHTYSLFNRQTVGSSYPIYGTDWCLMVPVRKEIPAFLYLVRPLQWKVWLLLLFSVFYISLVLDTFGWLTSDYASNNNNNSSRSIRGTFGESILNTIAFIVNIPTTFRLASAHWKQVFGLYIFLLLLGFIVSNYYTAFLASFMTTIVPKDDLDTLDDLIDQNISVMSQNFDAERLFKFASPSDLVKLKAIVKVVEPEEFNEHRNSFNQCYAYPVASDRWAFFQLQQKYSDRPLFRYSKMCFSKNQPVSFPMEYESHLYPSLKHFILMVHASGLIVYWTERDFDVAVEMHEMHRFVNAVGVEPITLETLNVAWLLLAFGYFVSGIAFLVELSLGYRRHKTIFSCIH